MSLGAIIGYSGQVSPAAMRGGLTSRAATLAGAFVRIPAASWFAVEPELLFARKAGETAALPAGAGRLISNSCTWRRRSWLAFEGPAWASMSDPLHSAVLPRRF